jgi:hypothetical protein
MSMAEGLLAAGYTEMSTLENLPEGEFTVQIMALMSLQMMDALLAR